MNTVLIIKCLTLSLLPIGIDAAVSWKDLTKMRKSAPRYTTRHEIKDAREALRLSKEEKTLIKEFISK